MTQDQIKAIETEIGAGLNLAGTVAGVIDPELIPFIVLGKAAAAAAPDLIEDIRSLIAGTEPDAPANQLLAAKIAALGTPESL